MEFRGNSIWLRARSDMTSHYTSGSVTTLHDLEVSWDGLRMLSFFSFLLRQKADMSTPKHRRQVHHLASFPSSREEISQPGFELPTSSLRFGSSRTIRMLSFRLSQFHGQSSWPVCEVALRISLTSRAHIKPWIYFR